MSCARQVRTAISYCATHVADALGQRGEEGEQIVRDLARVRRRAVHIRLDDALRSSRRLVLGEIRLAALLPGRHRRRTVRRTRAERRRRYAAVPCRVAGALRELWEDAPKARGPRPRESAAATAVAV